MNEYLRDRKQLIEKNLDSLMLAADGPMATHIESMRYSLFVGGKRIRPILTLAAAESLTADPQLLAEALVPACAIELIHTYSLIHDDLPAMDDDDLRRGKPTNHKVYGEANAILAGDGLLTLAFELLARPSSLLNAAQQLQIIGLVAQAAGPFGMVGGQHLDIENENNTISFDTLKTIHRCKTGCLITCSLQAGAICGGADKVQLAKLSEYGAHIGLAFQIVDDLLDATATTAQLGKTAGSDESRGKATYPALFGIEETRQKARDATAAAISSIEGFDLKADPLRNLADYICSRTF
ncbi:MAG: polyprenyl synthetase family protein [Desulfobulbaceae bacterium]|nr:MAG: polyprenyl synthetase family protein [Desulfobulbaceae bacterium]